MSQLCTYVWLLKLQKQSTRIELTCSIRTFVSLLFVFFSLWLTFFTLVLILCSISSNCHLTNSLSSFGVSTITLISLMTFRITNWNKIIQNSLTIESDITLILKPYINLQKIFSSAILCYFLVISCLRGTGTGFIIGGKDFIFTGIAYWNFPKNF